VYATMLELSCAAMSQAVSVKQMLIVYSQRSHGQRYMSTADYLARNSIQQDYDQKNSWLRNCF